MKKYLIIKIAAIGDVIMAMPMVRKIRQEEPQSHITWVCGKSVYSLLQKLPIDKLIVVDEKKLLGGSKPEKVKKSSVYGSRLAGSTLMWWPWVMQTPGIIC